MFTSGSKKFTFLIIIILITLFLQKSNAYSNVILISNTITTTSISTTSTVIPANELNSTTLTTSISTTSTIIPEGCGIVGNSCTIKNTNQINNSNLTNKINITAFEISEIKHLSNNSFWESQGYKIYNLTLLYQTAENQSFSNTVDTTNISATIYNSISRNWAGYLATGSSTTPFNTVTGAQSSWIVQNVIQQSTNNLLFNKINLSSQWVGIGGFNNEFFENDISLIQIGTESDNSPSSIGTTDVPSYFAWFQTLPPLTVPNTITPYNGPPIIIENSTNTPAIVKPNDDITALLLLRPYTTDDWFLFINDTTQKWVGYGDVIFTSNESSADFIEERVYASHFSTLQNFGIAYFGQDFVNNEGNEFLENSPSETSYAVINNNLLSLGSAPIPYTLVMTNTNYSAGNVFSIPDQITPDGTSFGVTYGNLSVIANAPIIINKGSTIHLVTNTITNFSTIDLSYQWYNASWDFGRTPVEIYGSNIITNNLTIAVNSPKIFSIFVTYNGVPSNAPEPTAYNYTIVKIRPSLIVPTRLNIGQSNSINVTCGNGDLCEIFINGNLAADSTTNIIYPWTPNSIGTYNVSAFDSSEGLYNTTIVNITAVNVPPGISSYFGLTITNNDPTNALTAGTDVCIPINGSAFNHYANGGFNNFKIFDMGGNVIDSWLEGNTACDNPGIATNAFQTIGLNTVAALSLWIKLTSTIPANTHVGNYLAIGFGPMTSNYMNGVTIGESPLLTCPNADSSGTSSCNYGEYDNGARVFTTLYQNFLGTGVPLNWTNGADLTAASINNGVSISGSFGQTIYTDNSFGSSNQIMDFFGNFSNRSSEADDQGFGFVNGGTTGSFQDVVVWGTDNNDQNVPHPFTHHTTGCNFAGGSSPSTSGIYSIKWDGVNTPLASYNYGSNQTVTKCSATNGPLNIGFTSQNSGSGLTDTVYWVRIRQYYPILPTFSNSTVINVTASNSIPPDINAANSIEIDSSNTITATCPGGDTCNILINEENAASGTSTASYAWTPSELGIYTVTALDVHSGLTNSTTVNVVPVGIPSGITNYAGINIQNNDPSNALTAGSAICIPIEADNFNQYANGGFNNVKVFDMSGNVIDSWLEGNTACGSYNEYTTNAFQTNGLNTTDYLSLWIKLPYTIAANTEAVSYAALGFGSMSSNFMNKQTIGESPILTCPNAFSSGTSSCSTYGEYDNGANVFTTLYENFSGITTPLDWTNNGITIDNGASANGLSTQTMYSDTAYGSSDQTLDFLGIFSSSSSGPNDQGFGFVNGNVFTGSFDDVIAWGTDNFYQNVPHPFTHHTTGCNAAGSSESDSGVYSLVWDGSNAPTAAYDYGSNQVVSACSSNNLNIGFTVQNSGSEVTDTVYWARIRENYPILPTYSFSTTETT